MRDFHRKIICDKCLKPVAGYDTYVTMRTYRTARFSQNFTREETAFPPIHLHNECFNEMYGYLKGEDLNNESNN